MKIFFGGDHYPLARFEKKWSQEKTTDGIFLKDKSSSLSGLRELMKKQVEMAKVWHQTPEEEMTPGIPDLPRFYEDSTLSDFVTTDS